jgi:hypothetical protein
MSSKNSVISLALEIVQSSSKVLFHQNRFKTLSKRIDIILDIVKTTHPIVPQAIDFLYGTLEDIKENLVLFSEKNALVANRIIIYGTDEEQFIKWGERMQHCIDIMGKSDKLFGVFDQKVDLKDFEGDAEDLRKSLVEILGLVGDKKVELTRLYKTLESLVGHQTNVRSTYQTKSAPTAALEMDHRKVKYEKIIGRGGFI